MITLNLPTSLSEIKEFWNTHKSKRARNNKKVITDLKRDVYRVLQDGYWKDDISNIRGERHLLDCFNKAFRSIE